MSVPTATARTASGSMKGRAKMVVVRATVCRSAVHGKVYHQFVVRHDRGARSGQARVSGSYLTAAAVNLKRLAALFALLWFWIARRSRLSIHGSHRSVVFDAHSQGEFEAA
jgi:hypothetical protein